VRGRGQLRVEAANVTRDGIHERAHHRVTYCRHPLISFLSEFNMCCRGDLVFVSINKSNFSPFPREQYLASSLTLSPTLSLPLTFYSSKTKIEANTTYCFQRGPSKHGPTYAHPHPQAALKGCTVCELIKNRYTKCYVLRVGCQIHHQIVSSVPSGELRSPSVSLPGLTSCTRRPTSPSLTFQKRKEATLKKRKSSQW